MKKILFIIFALLLTSPAYSYPFEINTSKEYNLPLEIEDFRYWYGDIKHGYLIYVGTKDVAGFETELHLYFSKNKIIKSLLILGPAGIDSSNCIKKYKKIVEVLNKKYGHYTHQRVIKDPIVDDLIAVSVCTPVKLGLYDVETHWKSKNLEIVSTLIGDDEGFYIEIEYITKKKSTLQSLKKIL